MIECVDDKSRQQHEELLTNIIYQSPTMMAQIDHHHNVTNIELLHKVGVHERAREGTIRIGLEYDEGEIRVGCS